MHGGMHGGTVGGSTVSGAVGGTVGGGTVGGTVGGMRGGTVGGMRGGAPAPGRRRGRARRRAAALLGALAVATTTLLALDAPAAGASPDVDAPRIVFTPNPFLVPSTSGWYTDLSAFGAVPFVVDFVDPAGLEVVGCRGDFAFEYGPPVLLGTTFGYSAGFNAQGVHAFECYGTDDLGNAGVGPGSSPMPFVIRIDTVPPSLTCRPAVLRKDAPGEVTADVTDATSGPATPLASTPVDTSALGTFRAAVTGADVAGNTATVECTYRVCRGHGKHPHQCRPPGPPG